MGCWGITAFESDAGLNAVGFIRKNLPQDGNLDLDKMIELLRGDEYYTPDVIDGQSHTGPMALAETLTMILNRDFSKLDYGEKWTAQDNNFSAVTSCIASKQSIEWLREYVSGTLKNATLNAPHRNNWGGWFKEADWQGWQSHMKVLVSRLDELLTSPENQIEFIRPDEPTNDMQIEQQML